MNTQPSTGTARTVIVTGASQGIGAGIARLFLERGYNVVASSRNITRRNELPRSDHLALVDGDIGRIETARTLVTTSLERFGQLGALVNNAGIFVSKPFGDYSPADFEALSRTNLEGFLHLTQQFVRQLLTRGTRGSIVNITASIADHPLADIPAAVAMITKGGIHAASRSLALEYAGQGIRVNVVAPGVVDTPLVKDMPREVLRKMNPMGEIGTARDIAEAVVYLTEAERVTGVVLPVDGGSHVGHW